MTEAETQAADLLMADLEDAVRLGEDEPTTPDTTTTEEVAA